MIEVRVSKSGKMAGDWYGGYTAGIWRTYGGCMADGRRTYGKHTADIRRTCAKNGCGHTADIRHYDISVAHQNVTENILIIV